MLWEVATRIFLLNNHLLSRCCDFHSSLSGDELSEADSLLSDGSISSGKKSGQGDGNNTDHKPSRRKKRKV